MEAEGGTSMKCKFTNMLMLFTFLLYASMPVVFAQVVCTVGSIPAFPGSDTCILDPQSIPKFVTPLVIPPVMKNNGAPDNYSIAVRQFKQQILPGGIWNTINGRTDAFPATTVWSYGPEADPAPDSSALGGAAGVAPAGNSQFNYPAFTIETLAAAPFGSGSAVSVRWINDLKDQATGNFLPHLLPVDQTLHWANPPQECMDMGAGSFMSTDCMGINPNPYTGPVPLVTHVHGAHVDPHSDGYPEAWFLPAANNIPVGYATKGRLFDDATRTNPGNLGYVDFSYRNNQPATTLWYHDHALGMTRSNVYAGPAGFWLIRGGTNDLPQTGNLSVLPGPAPVANQTVLELNVPTNPIRQSIREIPIVIQDRSFKPDGELFYPDNRAFFEGLNPAGGTAPVLDIPFAPSVDSDISPIWNPEAFFSTIVVNGVTWPKIEVAPALYRLRLLNGCNSRFLNLALFKVRKHNSDKEDETDKRDPERLRRELPFYQIGAEQGFLPHVVRIETGFATPLAGNKISRHSRLVKAPDPQQALLIALAERADVIVDFRGLPNGTRVRMINTAPDAPFGGFPDIPADPATTGQVMEFVVNATLAGAGGPLGASPTDPVLADGSPNNNAASDPWDLLLPAEGALTSDTDPTPRQVSLNEDMSMVLCVDFDTVGNLVQIPGAMPPLCIKRKDDHRKKAKVAGFPMGPKAALLGQVDVDPATNLPTGIPLHWTNPEVGSVKTVSLPGGATADVWVTENPGTGETGDWDIYNFTEDGHPIHLHLVRFQVIGRAAIGTPVTPGTDVQPSEAGFKDTVVALPGQVTRVRATFDIPGLFVWHCHILEHEDNEMMRPYFVGP
jgi:spore coat protein A, manganese oxidase